MKKLIVLALAVLLMVSLLILAGCGGEGNDVKPVTSCITTFAV